MAAPLDEPEQEKPLDPAMERVRQKLARLMVVSIGIMLVGLMTVLGAVVYRASGSGAPATVANAAIDLPDDFEIVDTAVSAETILFFGRQAGGNSRVFVFDLRSGELVATHSVE